MHQGGYPPQQQGGYPPQQGGYPPQQQGGYPPQQGGYPPQQGGYPPQQQGGYPPQQGGYPPQQQGGYPPQQQGGYPPQQQGGYPPQQGGYPPQQQGGYPPQQQGAWGQQLYNSIEQQKLAELRNAFGTADKDRSGSITVQELMVIRWNDGSTLSAGACQILAKVFDTDRSGKIEFQEFAQLYQFVTTIHQTFYAFDKDRSGNLDHSELVPALNQAGFYVSPQTADAVLKKFGRATMSGAKVDMDAFMQVAGFLGQLKSVFEQYDQQKRGAVTLSLEQLVNIGAGF